DVRAHLGRATAVFTEALPVIPRFALSNPAEVAAAVAAPPADEPALSAERWLTGVAAVRENVAAYTPAPPLAAAFGTAVPEAIPIQFPVVAGEPWVGEAAPTASGSRVSLLLLAPDRLDTTGTGSGGGTGTGGGGGAVAALCVDMWDEIIP